jgi:hypothetical protein
VPVPPPPPPFPFILHELPRRAQNMILGHLALNGMPSYVGYAWRYGEALFYRDWAALRCTSRGMTAGAGFSSSPGPVRIRCCEYLSLSDYVPYADELADELLRARHQAP